jgi:hypothetical protein
MDIEKMRLLLSSISTMMQNRVSVDRQVFAKINEAKTIIVKAHNLMTIGVTE